MSHSVTIRTQTVTTSSSTYYVNTGYLKTWGGMCKLLQLALGIICVGISTAIFHKYGIWGAPNEELFFLLMTTTFMIGTFIILISYLASVSTASIINKTIYEFIYHVIAFGLLFSASLTLITNLDRKYGIYESLLGASICGLLNSGFYLISAIIAQRSYKLG